MSFVAGPSELDCTGHVGEPKTGNTHAPVSSFVFAKSEMETCLESCIIHLPTKPPYSNRIDVLETDVLIIFSLPKMTNWRMTIEKIRKEKKLRVLLLACTLLQLNTLLWYISFWI